MLAKNSALMALVLTSSLTCFARGGTVGSAGQSVLTPSDIQITKETGVNYKGVYAENRNIKTELDHLYVLTRIVEDSKYDEKVITYKDLTPGTYQYRFEKIDKKHATPSPYRRFGGGCNSTPIEDALEELKDLVDKKTEGIQIVSRKNATSAALRLMSLPPAKTQGIASVLTIECSWTAPLAASMKVRWAFTNKPSTEWKKVIVKDAKNLTFIIPADTYGANFVLQKVD